MVRFQSCAIAAGVLITLVGTCAGAQAQSLRETLVQVYETNAEISAARAGQRATDELLPTAKASFFRPTITFSAEEGRERIKENDDTYSASGSIEDDLVTESRIREMEFGITLPLYRGGQTIAAIDEARAEILSGQAGLASTEQSVFSSSVTAYADVVFYRAVTAIREETVAGYEKRVGDTRQQVEAQRRTVGDLALLRNGLASARGSLASARGELKAAEGAYAALAGTGPIVLDERPSLWSLPESFQQALDIAFVENPALREAMHDVDEKRAAIRAEAGQLLPEIDLFATWTREKDSLRYTGNKSSGSTSTKVNYDEIDDTNTVEVGVELNLTLYEGGAVHAAVREAKQNLSQAILTHTNTKATVEGEVRAAWARLEAAREALGAAKEGVSATDDALEATEFQFDRGDTTTNELVTVINERASARVSLESAYQALLLAEATLLENIGRLNARGLELPVELYDPNVHLGEVEGKLFGLGD